MSDRICSVEGCEKTVDKKSLCSMHYSRLRRTGTTDKKIIDYFCKAPGCNEKRNTSLYCPKHHSRFRRNGSLELSIKKKKICSVVGCDKPYLAKGFCKNHYFAYRKYGDPLKSKEKKDNKNYRICDVNDCDRLTTGKNNKYCRMHKERFINTGDPNKTNKRVRKLCFIDGCNKLSHVRGLCSMHAHRIERYGDPFIVNKDFHGLTDTPEYRTLTDMKTRCYNPKSNHYYRYGGRGIIICDRWLNSYSDFIKDMGLKPFPEAQIDRINNDGNYEPDNCRWVTQVINARNKSNIKLDTAKVKHIKSTWDGTVKDKYSFAIMYNVSISAIDDVIAERTWKDVK